MYGPSACRIMRAAIGYTGSRWNAGAAPATVCERCLASPKTGPVRASTATQLAGTPAARSQRTRMTRTPLAALLGFAALAANAQQSPQVSRNPDPVVVTASRALTAQTTLRDAIVITREQLDG